MRALVLVTLLSACASDNSTKLCGADQVAVCTCAGGAMGTKICLANETGYGACACASPDLGAADLAMAVDFSAAVDAAMPDLAVTIPSQTAHAIDTGAITKGASVTLTNLTVLTPPRSFEASSHTQCKYEVWAQDPACTSPPCGLLLITAGIPKPQGAQYCPYASATTTLLHDVWYGDIVTVDGVVDTYASTTTAGTVTQHELVLDHLTPLMKNQPLPTPYTTTATGAFVPYAGAGWATYEGTLVLLSGSLTVSAMDQYGGWTTTPGNASFSDDFKFLYAPDGGTFPAQGSTYAKMGGVVSAGFGGTILPISSSDFVP